MKDIKNMTNKCVIAIDFDDTITKPSIFPTMGEIRPEAIEVIKMLKERYILILWTCREGLFLKEAVDALLNCGIKFDYINECPQKTRKVVADIYIDDRAFGGCVDWDIIKNELLK